jgi:hypothetical protein
MSEGEKHTRGELDDEPPPTDEELRAAEALARALDAKADPAPGSDAAFAAALRATKGTAARMPEAERSAIVDRALGRGATRARWRTGRVVLAAAAALLLAVSIPVGLSLTHAPAPAAPAITYGGPSDAVFDAPFPNEQRASTRMDLIVNARTHDYFSALDATRGAR